MTPNKQHDQYEEHDDDRPIGRLLTRREVLTLVAGAGAVLLVGCDPLLSGSATPTTAPTQTPPTGSSTGAGQATSAPTQAAAAPTQAAATATTAASADTLPSCVVRPELTEGPYFVDERLDRSDIRSDPSTGVVSEGVPLSLTFLVSKVGTGSCVPLEGAYVDVWHCDALGVYSDTTDPGFDTTGQKFLRGYQVTDAKGNATFTTIYPGWYQGRTVHIHFKIRTDPDSAQGYDFTSQLFFDDNLSDQVYTQEPYASKGERTLRNNGDGIYQGSGDQLSLNASKDGAGYAATFDIGLQID